MTLVKLKEWPKSLVGISSQVSSILVQLLKPRITKLAELVGIFALWDRQGVLPKMAAL